MLGLQQTYPTLTRDDLFDSEITVPQLRAAQEAEFDMTDRSARLFMQIATKYCGKSEIISDLKVTALYELRRQGSRGAAIRRGRIGIGKKQWHAASSRNGSPGADLAS